MPMLLRCKYLTLRLSQGRREFANRPFYWRMMENFHFHFAGALGKKNPARFGSNYTNASHATVCTMVCVPELYGYEMK
jgi:hypothetical protein